MKMNIKLKVIGIVLIPIIAVTVSYLKGVFDGSTKENISIVSIAQAKESNQAKGLIDKIKKIPNNPAHREQEFVIRVVKLEESVDFEVTEVGYVDPKNPNKVIDIKSKDFPISEVLGLRSLNVSFAYMEKSPGHWCVVDSIRYWCP